MPGNHNFPVDCSAMFYIAALSNSQKFKSMSPQPPLHTLTKYLPILLEIWVFLDGNPVLPAPSPAHYPPLTSSPLSLGKGWVLDRRTYILSVFFCLFPSTSPSRGSTKSVNISPTPTWSPLHQLLFPPSSIPPSTLKELLHFLFLPPYLHFH